MERDIKNHLKSNQFVPELPYQISSFGDWNSNVKDQTTPLNKDMMDFIQSGKLLLDTISRLDIVLWVRDYTTRRLLYISEGSKEVFGISQEDAFKYSSFIHVVHPEDEHILEEKIFVGHHELLEYRIIHPCTKEIRWIQSQVRLEKDDSGQIKVLHGISIDVTDRKHSEEVVRAQNEVLNQIALGRPLLKILRCIEEQTTAKLPGRIASILLVDPQRNVFLEGASHMILQNYHKTILEKPLETLHDPISKAVTLKMPIIIPDINDDWEQSVFKQMAIKCDLNSCYVYPIISNEHRVVAVFTLYSQIYAAPKKYELELIEALTHLISLAIERNDFEEKIYRFAYFDTLTGLYNRSYFNEHVIQTLKEAEQSKQKFALLYIDVDKFKWINDSLGHNMADQLLVQIAERMKLIVTGEEQGLFRIGGDEFMLLARDVATVSDAIDIAEKLINYFKESFFLMDHELRIGLSIGISVYPDHGLTANELISHTDTAMYQAKSRGRNNAKVYHTSYDATFYENFLLHTQLHKALVDNQFILHYQPRIELENGLVQSAEALIRWNHPERGLIMPGDFIPLSEESGFILTLGEWVLKEACRQNKEWQDRGYPKMRIAVNVSAQQFQQQSFISKIKEVLSDTGLAPEYLEIEITESALMNHEEKNIKILHQLNQMGVYVSVDDFGTGYSSLNYLKRFEVKALKIDRSFIHDLNDIQDVAITRMIISLAQSLRLEVIGEGVENLDQHTFLLNNGCHYAQGFLYNKPLTTFEMENQINTERFRAL
ncbi:EAL domain-containing protein [Paenibacillus sp. CGMCC 1.16610]|uniref:EAL domain-containing protein n=1 Tax=Paenibacillus anseongense TaxID=2682845 RepID=A0ABW9UKI6_9BACL|nr:MULTISPECIES: EAL domain-containing protein [Paenibacillus]MBA2939841.1 EAL domain-containing protein [Paenibacillus sp. CGMCC 1.16610]MVQ39501.1 EAL domain-containing protein [Paenibacillus anseongense]